MTNIINATVIANSNRTLNDIIKMNINKSLDIALGKSEFDNDLEVDYDILKDVVCVFEDYEDGNIYLVPGNEVSDMGNKSAREDHMVCFVRADQMIFFDSWGNAFITTNGYDEDSTVVAFGPLGLSKPIGVHYNNYHGCTYKSDDGWLCIDFVQYRD